VVGLTAVLSLLAVPFDDLRLALWRDQGALDSGEVWRLATPLLIQFDPWPSAVCVLALNLVIGTAVERVYGQVRWLEVYLACGIVGQAFGYLWDPPDAGSSVAGAGLLGALCAWLLSPAARSPLPPRVLAGVGLAAGLALVAAGDMHGPPLLLGGLLGALFTTRRYGRDRFHRKHAKEASA
jgi:membrane associated rhomboid family serine protease